MSFQANKIKCANCKYWGHTSNITGSTVTSGRGCRRRSPTGTGINDWKWPSTKEDDWCGEFKPMNKLRPRPFDELVRLGYTPAVLCGSGFPSHNDYFELQRNGCSLPGTYPDMQAALDHVTKAASYE